MICPKCGNESDKNICKSCNVDINEFIRVDNKSVVYYNQGLELARENNITEAIIMLKKSIQFNSTNIIALNLLGLCYDKIGRIADASKYWILSCLVEENNVAADYLEEVEKNLAVREKINDSIVMYNKALSYARQGSEDMAIIQLKKAIDLNPSLIDAINLLALCHMRTNAVEAAIKCAKKVLDIDCGNKTAIQYIESLNGGKIKSTKVAKVKSIQPSAVSQNLNINPIAMDYNGKTKKNNSSIAPAMGFLFGALCVSIFSFYVLMPSVEKSAKDTMASQTEFYELEKNKFETELSDKESKINELELRLSNLEEENNQNINSLNLMIAENQVRQANDLYKDGNYVDAALIIFETNSEHVVGEDIDTYITVRDGTYEKASLELYNRAIRSYDNQQYEQSLIELEKSVDLGGMDTVYYDDILYYKGRNYELLSDIKTALDYYNTLVLDYPTSDFLSRAESRINRIND